jgi:hypothetical protein
MVVTSSRLHAVRYMNAFKRYLEEKKITDIRPLVAFSGKVKDPKTGMEYTEPGMNLDCVSGEPISRSSYPPGLNHRTTRSCWWRTSTRPALTSPCSAPCTWTNAWMGCRRFRRFPG